MRVTTPSYYNPLSQGERRRQRRTLTHLNVRFMLDDGREQTGYVSNVCVGGMAIVCETRPPAGSSVIAYVQELGRLEGIVSRIDPNGFIVRLTLSAIRREKLEERLGVPNKTGAAARKHEREEQSGMTRIQRADGREITCRVIDLSLGGVSVATSEWPPIGEQVMVGKMRGKVVRHHEVGIAIEFQDMRPSRGSLAEQLMSDRSAA